MKQWTNEEVDSLLAPEDMLLIRVAGSQAKTFADHEQVLIVSSRIHAERVGCRNSDSVVAFCREVFSMMKTYCSTENGRVVFLGTNQGYVERQFGEIEQRHKREKRCHADDNGFYCFCDEHNHEG